MLAGAIEGFLLLLLIHRGRVAGILHPRHRCEAQTNTLEKEISAETKCGTRRSVRESGAEESAREDERKGKRFEKRAKARARASRVTRSPP